MDAEHSNPLDVLLVEDSEDDALLLRRQLQDAGYQLTVERVDTGEALHAALTRKRWDIVFSDFSMPKFNGMQALAMVRQHDPDLPFIIVSGTIGEERAAQSMRLGAQDYVIKGNVQRLIPAVERELKEAKLRREHRLAQERIRRLAYYDHLTQLPNRHRLDEDLGRLHDDSAVSALMIVNLANFNEINAAFGYGKGDELLCEAALRLQQAVANKADLYHLHGDTFALLMQCDARTVVEALAQDIIKVLGSHYVSTGLRVHIGGRIGIVPLLSPDTKANTLLQRAHTAVNFAKGQGRPFAWYERANDPGAPQRLALLADLHDALGTDQLFLVFQPKIRCATDAITGCEALMRWRHPEQGMIAPDIFIEMAERSGLIDDLTRQVVALALSQAAAWQKRGASTPVAINLSARNLLNGQIIAEILDARTPLTGGHHPIEIEITETALMSDPEQALTALRRLDEAGIRIYIDDFGTGFSSLGYLKKLPIHAIKIDKSFVLDVVRDADSDTIVRSTISLAHNLGLEVVAEGVENRETWELLKSYGCDQGQGYYFDKPLSPDEFQAKILGGGSRDVPR